MTTQRPITMSEKNIKYLRTITFDHTAYDVNIEYDEKRGCWWAEVYSTRMDAPELSDPCQSVGKALWEAAQIAAAHYVEIDFSEDQN